MKRIWTLLGGVSGFFVGGPVGAIIGAALGELLTNNNEDVKHKAHQQFNTGGRRTQDHLQPGDFHISLLILSAVVIKADGKVDQRELDYVRSRFVAMFGKEKANESFKLFKNIVNQEIQLKAVTDQIRRNMAHSGRLQLIHFLFGVARADGHADGSELNVIHKIARYLYVSDADFESIRATFMPKNDIHAAYKVLEIDESATDADIKKAYRKMAVKYHPDKLQHLGADVQKAAEEKFVKVQEAYDAICKQRKI